ncbi:MAG TPA: ABC transporter ATP-binding protein [Terriglobales bacterium]|nr:ABC transporter ATP-binding protein [Terriglobales bacterium]
MDATVTNSDEVLALVRGLSVTYEPDGGQPVRALVQASLSIGPGESLGILGESGSGKSTLASALLRLLPANARYMNGAILFRGCNLLEASDSELRNIRGARIALIPQDPALALNPVISVGDQIAEVLRAHIRTTGEARRTRVEELLAEVGFDQPRQIYPAYPHQLSGGQRQRIAIAQAMACHPALIIADEPTSKLDASLQTEILALMRRIGRQHGSAFVLISHDPTVLAGFVDRIAVMYAGRVIEEGSTEDIFRRPLHPYTQALVRLSSRYLAMQAVRTPFAAIHGEPPDLTETVAGCPYAERCEERMPVCSERGPQETAPELDRRVRCFKYEH